MSLLFLVVFAVILLNLGTIRENLEVPIAQMGGRCVDGFRTVGDKCVSIDPTASIAPREPAPCPTGCTFYNGGCLKDDTIYCMDQQRENEPKCISIRGRPFSEAQCPFGTCPGGKTSVVNLCVGPCPPGKKVQGELCVSDDASPSNPSCPAGYRYAGGSNSCIPPSGGEFVCPSGATKVRGGDGSVSCLDNSRLQEALNHRGPGGRVTLVDPPPQQRPAEPQGVPSCNLENFAAY
jgi:hypothetical protein